MILKKVAAPFISNYNTNMKNIKTLKRNCQQLMEELEWEKERLTKYLSERDSAISTGKFDKVAEMDTSISIVLEHKEYLETNITDLTYQIEKVETLT